MRKAIELEALEEYLACGVSYRFRYVYEMPYRVDEASNAIVTASRKSVTAWFSHLARGDLKHQAKDKVLRILMKVWGRIGGTADEFPSAHSYVVATLAAASGQFHPEKDTPIGGGVRISLPGDELTVNDRADGLFLKNDKLPQGGNQNPRKLIVVQVRGDQDVIVGPRLDALRAAMTRWTVGTATQGMRISSKLLTIRVPSMTKHWDELRSTDYREARYLLESTRRAMSQNVFLPAAERSKCLRCWWAPVCSSAFTLPTVSPAVIARAKTNMSKRARNFDADTD